MANELVKFSTDSDNYFYRDDFGFSYGTMAIGKNPILGTFNGMLRFPTVPVGQGVSVYGAELKIYASNASSTSGTLRSKTYGINEDNTGTLTGDPTGRGKTSSSTTNNSTRPSSGNYLNISVTSQVNQILARGGWVNGNAMGFFIDDTGSDADTWISSNYSTGLTYLVINVTAAPNFFPTPSSVAAPTFPDPSSQGLKISKPGVNVLTAAEDDLLLWTRKKEFKIIKQGEESLTAGVAKNIAHGLAYAPAHLAYVESGGYRLKLNRSILGAIEPIAGAAQGYIGADTTNVTIVIDQNKNVYYYVFIDPLSE